MGYSSLWLFTFMHLEDLSKSHLLHVIFHILSNALGHLVILCTYCIHTANIESCVLLWTNPNAMQATFSMISSGELLLFGLWMKAVQWCGFSLSSRALFETFAHKSQAFTPSAVACVPGDCAIRKNSHRNNFKSSALSLRKTIGVFPPRFKRIKARFSPTQRS